MTTRNGIMGLTITWKTIATLVIVGVIAVGVITVLLQGNWTEIVASAVGSLMSMLPFGDLASLWHSF